MPRLLAVIGLLGLLALIACSEPGRPTIGLYPALQQGDIDQIKRHIYWGTDINQAGPEGRMPLHVASQAGRWVVVELLLDNGANINVRNRQGHTPLHEALMSGRTRVAQLLIKRGASLDANRLLEEVVINQVADRDVIVLLIRQGADINHSTESGDTPLHMAVKQGYRVLAKLLITHGADVNASDATGHTPLWYASARQDGDIIRLLKRNGAVAR